ncbi:uncharacterized protein LOC141898322 [Tubulanus polymorphus]|uniref:uncharacterized protein LOC141898322 n=1 Tax=Tubulanus polymorphus TaxID=672921 RepID=UPI003DA1ED1E
MAADEFETGRLYELLSLVEEGLCQAVQQEMKSGIDVKATDEYGDGYLHILCGNSGLHDCNYDRYIPVIYMLANAGLDVNARNKSGNTALHFAVTNKVGHVIVNTLLKLGADPKLKNNEGLSPDGICADPLQRKTIELFNPGLYEAITSKSISDIERLIDYWCVLPVNHRDILSSNSFPKAQEAADDTGKDINSKVKVGLERNQFYHLALADDRAKMKEIYKKDTIDLNALDLSNIDENDGEIRPKPLIALLLELNCPTSARFLMKKGIDVNIPIQNARGRMPFFIYACKHCDKPRHSLVISVMKHANLEPFVKKISINFLHQLWQNELPSEIIGFVVDAGFNLGMRDEDCLTLRDRIFFSSLSFEPERIKESLHWVDQHVLNMVVDGKLDRLETLFNEGYEYLIVENLQGRNSISLAKKHNQKEVAAFLEEIPVLQNNARSIFFAIRRGNLSVMKSLINDKNSRVRDGAGRTYLHIAALFARRFMVNFLIKNYPALVSDQDVFGRTPLHYACLLPDGMDVELVLVNAGASGDAEDTNDYKPIDYKKGCMGDKYVDLERKVKYGIDVYLVQRYFELVAAIKNGFDERVTRIHKSMYEDTSLNDFERLDSTTKEKIAYRNLVYVALDNDREKIAVYLIQEGMDPMVNDIIKDEETGSRVVNMVEAATELEMFELVKILRKKRAIAKFEKHASLIVDSLVSRPPTTASHPGKPGSAPSVNGNIQHSANDNKTDDARPASADNPHKSGSVNKSAACQLL